MPGERVEDALAAASELQASRLGTVLTRRGENVRDMTAADETMRHYVDLAREIRARSLDTHISVKLTQLGLDVDEARCHANVVALAKETQRHGVMLWLDMEQSPYVDRTIAMRRALGAFPHVGICLQAYLHRTPDDLAALLPLGGGIRLVKGAYREPPAVALLSKADVDERYFTLATEMLSAARTSGLRAVFGTHDRTLLHRLEAHARDTNTPRDAFEFHLLYGIQRTEQQRLAQEGYPVKVLISYGEQWFPWYMRRLAERPANLWFVARSLFAH
jgi:proline dehydrogenase